MSKFCTFIENAISWAISKQTDLTYQYKCLAFVEDAYEKSNNIEMFGGSTATESAEMYGYNKIDQPIKGSFVFYSSTGPIGEIVKNWGHVGLCIGKNMVIHTWDKIRIDNYLEVELLQNAPGWNQPKYLGWTPPEVFLKGFVSKMY
ncbi:MAG TPA: NlpC/P60 family protein, partial [Chitinispirillaceae bacterium]|nr:NlpC/P60 family protein [Chitinispirillaceae bacterium]